MGEQFKSLRAKQFRYRQDAARQQELETSTIFSNRPDVFETDYRCRPTEPRVDLDSCAPFYAQCNGSEIKVFQRGQLVGHVEGGREAMQEAMRSDTRCCGLMRMKLQARSFLSGFFDLRCAEIETHRG